MNTEVCYFPLSHPQQRIWYIEKFYQGTSIGNIAATVEIKEEINYNILKESINTMIEKNDGLRLRIVVKDGQVMQYIADYKYVKIDILDFSEKGYEALYEWEKQQSEKPFIVEDSDLYYFALIKINQNKAFMFMNMHHLINDAWTMVLLANKILEYYKHLKVGNEISFGYPSYTEFIHSEQEYEKSKRFSKDMDYWNSKFETIPEPASLKCRDTGHTGAEAKRSTFIIPNDFTTKIREFCYQNKTSVFSVFLSILSIFIYRVTGNEDIVIGTPVLNRSNFKEKDTLGIFVSTVPIRIKMDGDKDYITYIKSSTSDWMGMLRHQRYPYELLLKDLRKKNKNVNNLYDILLSYQNGKFNKNDTEFEGRWHSNGYQADSLFIHINDREADGCLTIDYDYMTRFFNEQDIDHIHKCLINLLSDSIDNTLKLINQLDIITDVDKKRILSEFNDTTRSYPREKTMHQLFEEQVAKDADNVAVVFEDKQLTYGQLNEKSNQLAKLLRIKGIKQDSIVGILVDRSLEMIISIMAVLKAGGCYLPIDPEYPIDRINYMLKDSGSKVLLTQELIANKIDYNGTIIDIFKSDIYNFEANNLDNINTPDNLAYVIYTSGSTGKPKAVMLEHGGLVNYIEAVDKLLDYETRGTVLSVTTIAFDIFVFELFPSLAKGLKIILANEQQQKIPEMLSELIIKEKVEKILTTPSRMQQLVFGQGNAKCFNVLKEIVLGGEAFPPKLLDKLQQVTKARIFNLYGPTEATVYATFKELTNAKDVNIGSPLANYKIYIVDKNLNIVPIGVQGELCIGGDSLARGYLNKPELTNEKFVGSPFKSGSKIYRTGDLCKWNSTGEIEFIGRMDHQIKIRGYRIELGEIENQLMDHELVRDAVVIDKEGEGGKKYLSAYYVSDIDIETSELKGVLSQKLPNYMVPSYFTRLSKIPITPNGKVNKRILPEPMMMLHTTEGGVATRNDIDEKLVSIWTKVLNVNEIGIDDNFFEIGGDSLTIIDIQIEMLKYSWNLNTQEFYKYNTIRSLSDRIAGVIDHPVINIKQEIAATNQIINDLVPVKKYKQGFKYRNILLTGATGFLGIHILKEIISYTDVVVHCVIRDQTINEARERLQELLEFYFPDDFSDIDLKRILVIKGDVSKEKFGFDEATYNRLGVVVDLVIHTAALVKYFGLYEDFKKVNITGTETSATFCMEFNKHLAYISTLGVSGNYLVDQEQKLIKFTEHDFYVGQRYMDNMYIRSKFEAEKLLYEMIANGLSASIFRIGNLTGRSTDGQFQSNADENAFYNILRSLIKLEAINKEILEQRVEFTPVDLCSKAIATLLNVEDSSSGVYHVFNHNLITLSRLLEVFKIDGINIEPMDRDVFSEYIEKIVSDDQKNKYLVGIVNDLSNNKSLDFGSIIDIDSSLTINRLNKLEFEWYSIDELYILKIINNMKSTGYLT